MAIIKTRGEREISELQKVEEQIRRGDRMRRIHHIIIAALGTLLVASAAAHVCGRHRNCRCHKK